MKNRYKLMNNYLYGKAMENLKDKSDLKLLSNEKDDLKWTSKPRYISQKIFDNDLVQFVKTNTQDYIRMCILDLSKELMYKFHYD